MDVTSTHTKNLLTDWDISASAKADKGEKIARAQILVNDFSEYDQLFDPPLTSWQEQLNQKGDYPGDNKVQVIVSNEKGEDFPSEDSWSS